MQKHGLGVTKAGQLQGKHKLQADVVVIGSGAGGAVAAYELAKAGRKVIIIEAGPYVPSSEFTEDLTKGMAQLYAGKGTQANVDGDLMVLQGRCVGGSTVVNGCVALRTPDYILADWQQQFGLTDLTVERLAPYFARVEQHLSVHPNAEWELNANAHQIIRGCEALGVSWHPIPRNVKACALTGHCLAGCASDRKQSMLVTYLPWALAKGATLYADTTVTRIHADQGVVNGVTAEMRDPNTGDVLAQLELSAKQVVLAAGAVQTPLLLNESGLAQTSGQVGKNFACHPSCLVVADYDERVDSWSGALLGISVDEWMHPSKGGFLLEAGGAGPVELSGVTETGTGQAYMDYMARVGHLAGLVTLIHDHNHGVVSREGGVVRIDYRLTDADHQSMLKSISAAARVHLAAGANRVYLPTIRKMSVKNESELVEALANIPNEPHTFRMVSYHPQGTCRMGADPATSVVNPRGEVHDVKGLFITDASLFPTSLIVNPQLTVYAMANYIADHMLGTTA